jgi:hypothetical protein
LNNSHKQPPEEKFKFFISTYTVKFLSGSNIKKGPLFKVGTRGLIFVLEEEKDLDLPVLPPSLDYDPDGAGSC